MNAEPTGLVAILTRYRGPTEHRGARIVAHDAYGKRSTTPYDHALDGPDNHAQAALHHAATRGWCDVDDGLGLRGGATTTGYAWVFIAERTP